MATDDNTQEYKGPGKITASVGRGVVEGVVVGAAAVGVTAIFSKSVRSAFKVMVKPFQAFLHLRNPEKLRVIGEEMTSINGADAMKGVLITSITGTAGTVAGGLHGLYRGAVNAGAAQDQVADLNESLAQSQQETGKARQEAVEQKKFAQSVLAQRAKEMSKEINAAETKTDGSKDFGKALAGERDTAAEAAKSDTAVAIR